MKTHVPSNFIWLNITQAIGSFMDNLFKMLTVFYLADALGLPLERTLAISTVLLVVPFIILSNLAGALADRYSKTKLIHIVKWAELALIALSFPAYFSGRAWPMLTVLTLLACQSAFFGPLKRGIIPETVPPEAVAEANPNTVVVLHNGSPVEMPWIGKVKAVLEAYLGGQAVGLAEVRVLFGDVNPSGHLPETFPVKLADNPSYLFYGGEGNVAEYREGIFVGYRSYDKKEA